MIPDKHSKIRAGICIPRVAGMILTVFFISEKSCRIPRVAGMIPTSRFDKQFKKRIPRVAGMILLRK